jgi:hypothetical protein
MPMSFHQNAEQNHNIKILNKSSENVAEFKYFGMTIKNQFTLIKSRLNLGMLTPILSFHLLSKNLKIKI